MKPLGEMIAVMQACNEGKPIQCRLKGEDGWSEAHADKNWEWNWHEFDYRVNPAPVKPMKIIFFRLAGTVSFSGPQLIRREDVNESESQIEFIELTPEVKAKLNL